MLHLSQTDNLEEFVEEVDAGSTTNNYAHCSSDQCKRYIKILEDECQQLRSENMELKQNMHILKFDEKGFENNDEKVRTLTGFPSFPKLKLIYGYVQPWLMTNASIPVSTIHFHTVAFTTECDHDIFVLPVSHK